MRCSILLALGLVCFAASPHSLGADTGALERAAQVFGHALTQGRPASVRRILPETGKVQLSLVRLGPEDGAFSPPQVEALLRDFLAHGSAGKFEVHHVQGDAKTHAVVYARLSVRDREGRPARVGVHLAFHREGDRWVLRGIKETEE